MAWRRGYVKGTLAVRAMRDNGRIRIDVEDDGVGLPEGWTIRQPRDGPAQSRLAPQRRSSAMRPRSP